MSLLLLCLIDCFVDCNHYHHIVLIVHVFSCLLVSLTLVCHNLSHVHVHVHPLNNRHITRPKRSQVHAEHVRHLLLRRARVHAAIETPSIDRGTNRGHWDHVGGILDL